MPDTIHRFFPKRLPLVLVLALMPCLLSNSCASTAATRMSYAGRKLSQDAEVAYQFLVYQDLLRQGQKDEAARV